MHKNDHFGLLVFCELLPYKPTLGAFLWSFIRKCEIYEASSPGVQYFCTYAQRWRNQGFLMGRASPPPETLADQFPYLNQWTDWAPPKNVLDLPPSLMRKTTKFSRHATTKRQPAFHSWTHRSKQAKPSAARSKVNERAPLSTYSPVSAGLTAGETITHWLKSV